MDQSELPQQGLHLDHKHVLAIVSTAFLLIVTVLALVVYRSGWNWTGFNSYAGPELKPNQYYRPEKTLWDWMQLFLIPAALAVIGIWFNWTQNRREQSLADDRQKETTLETYLASMANLMLHEKLCVTDADSSMPTRQIALTQTLTTLQRLDSRRRAVVVRFLYESHLIDKDKPVIDLRGTILDEASQWFYALSNKGDVEVFNRTGANLEEVDLRGVNLKGAVLSGVNLRNAVMRGAFLSEADLSGANLSGVDLRWANLGGANLSHVTLSGAKLGYASLRCCELREADLRGAIWGEGADLSYAKLFGARIDSALLSKARLESADMEATGYCDSEPPAIQELSESEAAIGKMDGPMLEKAVLMSCSLGGANLQKANLRKADLTDAYLNNANLQRADLRGAILDGTELRGADLRSANLDGAELRGADLREAKLQGAIVTSDQLAKAKCSTLETPASDKSDRETH